MPFLWKSARWYSSHKQTSISITLHSQKMTQCSAHRSTNTHLQHGQWKTTDMLENCSWERIVPAPFNRDSEEELTVFAGCYIPHSRKNVWESKKTVFCRTLYTTVERWLASVFCLISCLKNKLSNLAIIRIPSPVCEAQSTSPTSVVQQPCPRLREKAYRPSVVGD